ncbi:MAG TPA: hypothetical protein VFS90_22635 [Pyrinomonadaceae bacterium]|nr:hypothetical protein [Pyrinomonadaceae bacterium]
MKNLVVKGVAKLGLLAVMTIIAAGVSANAQSLNYRLTANIPFEFSVSGTKLPAGKYWINRAQLGNGDAVVQIRSTDGHEHVTRLTIPISTLNPMQDGTLIFHRYGEEYFLSEIWPAGGSTGRVLPKSRVERELQRKAQGTGIAELRTPQLQLRIVTIRTSNLP